MMMSDSCYEQWKKDKQINLLSLRKVVWKSYDSITQLFIPIYSLCFIKELPDSERLHRKSFLLFLDLSPFLCIQKSAEQSTEL